MSDVLSQVLQYKRQKEQEARADIDAIPLGIEAFTQAKQAAQKSVLDSIIMQSTIAKNNADILKTNRESGMLEQFFKGGSSGNFAIPEATIGGMKVVNRQVSNEMEQDTANNKNVGDARKNLDEYAGTANEALVALDKIDVQADSLGDFKRGFVNQAISKTKAAAGEFGKDENIVRYKGVVAQELIPLARKLAEEKGPISDSDVSRIEKGLGDVTTPLADKKFLTKELRNKIKQALINKAGIAKLSDEEARSKYGEIYKKLETIEPEKSGTSSNSDSMISVVSPDGKSGKIPQSKLEAALKAGYKRGK